jgi:hypothetical protein
MAACKHLVNCHAQVLALVLDLCNSRVSSPRLLCNFEDVVLVIAVGRLTLLKILMGHLCVLVFFAILQFLYGHV